MEKDVKEKQAMVDLLPLTSHDDAVNRERITQQKRSKEKKVHCGAVYISRYTDMYNHACVITFLYSRGSEQATLWSRERPSTCNTEDLCWSNIHVQSRHRFQYLCTSYYSEFF